MSKNFLERIKTIRSPQSELYDAARAHVNNLTKPIGSLGRLEELAIRISAMQNTMRPDVGKKAVITMAADHGVADENVSAFPKEVTVQMLLNFISGGAAVNAIAGTVNADVFVVDIGVDAEPIVVQDETPFFKNAKIRRGTANFTKGPAMSREEAVESLITGMRIADELMDNGYKILGTGDMGIANTTPSAAIVCCFTGISPDKIAGRGTGISDESLKNKIAVIEKALAVNKPNREDAIDVLAKVGGLEIGGLAGVILAAASRSVPVVVDGFISTAAAMIAKSLAPESVHYMIFAHLSKERGHERALEHFDVSPLLDLELRLGEGTGAALAFSIVQAAVDMFNKMATFGSAGVSNKVE